MGTLEKDTLSIAVSSRSYVSVRYGYDFCLSGVVFYSYHTGWQNRVKVNGPYFVRAGLMWRKIETWCDDAERSGSVGEAIKSTLLPG